MVRRGWGTQIRVAAPESGAIAAQYTFLSMKGALLPLNTATNGGSAATSSSNSLALALNANQPIEVDLLGPTGGFTNLQDGSVYAQFLCPDAATCMDVAPQLIYSALPTTPYSLSVPITWDGSEQYRWSVVGINDGNVHHLSFAIYNADTTATAAVSYTVQVYDDTGTLVGTGTPPAIPQQITAGSYGAAGVWAAQDLSNVLPSTTTLPSGPLKVVFSGPDRFDVMAIQFIDGPIGQSAATTLQVAPTPGSSASSASLRRANVSRVASTPRPVFGALAE